MTEVTGIVEGTPPQEKNYTITDMAKEIAKSDPETFGHDGKFPIFKSEEHGGELVEVTNNANITRWIIKQVFGYYEKQGSGKNEGKISKIARLFSRKMAKP